MILITSKYNQKSQPLPSSIDLTGTQIRFSTTVRNLGVILDQNLSFQQHISSICKLATLNYAESVQSGITCHKMLWRLICVFVLSWIDYCNSLLAGCPKQLLQLQNNAAHLTYQHHTVSPILLNLHWLLVEQRTEYKLLVLASNLWTAQIHHICVGLLQFHVPSCPLRSSSIVCMLCACLQGFCLPSFCLIPSSFSFISCKFLQSSMVECV